MLGVLIEGNEAQRPWLLRAESAEDVSEWTPVFQRACKEAQPSCDPDPLIHDAFMQAYKGVRRSQNLWGSWAVWGSEQDMLAGLVMDVLHERIMADIYDAIPKGAAKNTVLKMVKKTVNGMVRAAVTAAYKAAIMSIKAVQGPCAKLPRSPRTLLAHGAHIDQAPPLVYASEDEGEEYEDLE